MASDGKKSKILVIGGTGYIGRHVVAASARLGHPTFALVRDVSPGSDPAKAQLLKSFQDSGVTLLKGDLYDHASLVSTIKAVDVVISTLGRLQIADQTKLIAAIKEAGNVKVNQKMILTLTASIMYWSLQKQPQPSSEISEQSEPSSMTSDAASDIASEDAASTTAPSEGEEVTSLSDIVSNLTADDATSNVPPAENGNGVAGSS